MAREYDMVGIPRKWQFGLLARLALALTLGFSIVISAILIIGAANPLYPPNLRVIPGRGVTELITNWFLLSNPSESYMPLTLEVEADMNGAERWGIWLGSGRGFHSFYIYSDGEFQANSPYFQPSASIRAGVNRVYLYVAANIWQDPFISSFHLPAPYQVTMRINDDIVWNGTIPAELGSWGIIGDENVDWKTIKIYTSG